MKCVNRGRTINTRKRRRHSKRTIKRLCVQRRNGIRKYTTRRAGRTHAVRGIVCSSRTMPDRCHGIPPGDTAGARALLCGARGGKRACRDGRRRIPRDFQSHTRQRRYAHFIVVRRPRPRMFIRAGPDDANQVSPRSGIIRLCPPENDRDGHPRGFGERVRRAGVRTRQRGRRYAYK